MKTLLDPIVALVIAVCAMLTSLVTVDTPQERAAAVQAIVRADYQGDRTSLRVLALALQPSDAGPDAALVRYWRGFAWWRRAINGFNETPAPSDLDEDLARATEEFERMLVLAPDHVDAVAGLLSCVMLRGYLHRSDPDVLRTLVPRFRELLHLGRRLDPDHPRLLWVLGQSTWYTPPGTPEVAVLARQREAVAMYEQALRRLSARPIASPLEPRWGEPELLMNLAWSHLHLTVPDVEAARTYADRALALVPDWHYVRDIILPDIDRAARAAREADR